MTSTRQSFCIALEKDFGKGNPGTTWTAVPPGSFLQTTSKRDVTRINTMGKRWADAFAYGQFKGTWDWNFVLDYNYLEPLLLIYDTYEYKNGVHTFTMSANKRPPSFCIRRVILHGIAGNKDTYPDEIGIIKGCVATTLRFSQSGGTSQMNVQMGGFYVNEELHRVRLQSTDADPYENVDGLAEYFCLFMDELADECYVANTESLGVDVGSSASPIANTCCPFSQQWYQGYLQFAFNTSCYANDPKRYKERVFRGGRSSGTKPTSDQAARHTSFGHEHGAKYSGVYNAQFYERGRVTDKDFTNASSYGTDIKDTTLYNGGYMLTPGCKGLAPLDNAYVVSYSKCIEYDEEGQSKGVTNAITTSDKYVMFHIQKCAMASATWQKGDGSKLYDQLSSAECQMIDIAIKNTVGSSLITSAAGHTAFALHPATLAQEES